jgi:hypothetical protein
VFRCALQGPHTQAQRLAIVEHYNAMAMIRENLGANRWEFNEKKVVKHSPVKQVRFGPFCACSDAQLLVAGEPWHLPLWRAGGGNQGDQGGR